jgi:hypothetical protein
MLVFDTILFFNRTGVFVAISLARAVLAGELTIAGRYYTIKYRQNFLRRKVLFSFKNTISYYQFNIRNSNRFG